jgi:hypothetical protein
MLSIEFWKFHYGMSLNTMLALLISTQENAYMTIWSWPGAATCWYLRAAFHSQLCNAVRLVLGALI